MRIAIFTNNYLPNPYGVSTSIETFRAEFEKLGHIVYIFAPRWPGYVDENPRVFRYPSIDIKIKFRFPLPVPHSWKMRKILKNLDIDIIHSQHPNLLGSAAARWAKKKKIPLVFTWHTLYDHYVHFAKFVPKKWAVGYIIKKAVKYANHADALIVPTDSIIPILREWGVRSKNITPIATGISEDEFSAQGGSALGGKNPDGENIREKHGIGKDEIVLLLASRLTEEKNIFFVFDSVKEILKNNDKVKFLVVGGGYLKKDLMAVAKKEGIFEKVILAGEVPHSQVKNYFVASDIFVYGSKSETQGMFTSEAMYMGLPVVALDATGTSSLVLNNASGFLVKENKVEFAKAVQKLIDDKELRARFSEAARRIARTQFTSLICAKKLLEVYEKAIAKKIR